MKARRAHQAERGFSLVETVAALGVLSLAAVPLMQLSSDAVVNTARLESRLLARTTAENVLARAMADNAPLVVGQENGREEQLGREYDWSLTILPTEREDLLRLEVQVRESDREQVLARLATLRAVEP
ncbi:type II secretion system minor pseudopilin GspI [Henriciella sp. AS95]|uniref:type II secretion system minor pseudopilin GspI n=1 Tax=Henriciella sp. AS95 TaxID=3135782 RepID=UPI003172AE9D